MSVRDPALQNLLFASAPLLRMKRLPEDIHGTFRQAWIEAARDLATKTAKLSSSVDTPAAHAIALFHTAIAIAEIHDVPRVELVQAFNDRAESGARATKDEIDTTIALAVGLVAAIAAAREEQLLPAPAQTESAA